MGIPKLVASWPEVQVAWKTPRLAPGISGRATSLAAALWPWWVLW